VKLLKPFDLETRTMFLLLSRCAFGTIPDILLMLTARFLGQNYRPEAVCGIRDLTPKSLLKSSRYCVRPNSGLIQPNGTVDVQGTTTIELCSLSLTSL
jgi:hypothetical protein